MIMRRLLIALALLAFAALPARAASTPDPCVSAAFKQSAAVSMNSATTTAVVPLVANKGIWVCGFVLNVAGSASTAATATLEYGTGSNCAANITTLTGALGSGDAAVSTTPAVYVYGNGGASVAIVPPGSGLCVLTAGTTVLVTGIVTYVQSTGTDYP
jgi:hypothetical protein